MFILLMRRKPFLLKKLEDVMITLLVSLEFYSEEDRRKLALAVSGLFLHKLPVLPDKVLGSLLMERLVEGGVVLAFLTDFIKAFLATSSMDELVSLLNKAKVAQRLEEYFPAAKRSFAAQSAHFEEAELPGMTKWLAKRHSQAKVAQIRMALKEVLDGEEEVPLGRVTAMCQKRKTEGSLEDADVARTIFLVLMESISPQGKGQAQVAQASLSLLKDYEPVMNAFVSQVKDEKAVLDAVQSFCYEHPPFLKLFADLVRILYEVDVLGEDTIRHWTVKGTNPKGRQQFLKDLEPFIKWLDEAEEEEEEDDDDDEEEEDEE